MCTTGFTAVKKSKKTAFMSFWLKSKHPKKWFKNMYLYGYM